MEAGEITNKQTQERLVDIVGQEIDIAIQVDCGYVDFFFCRLVVARCSLGVLASVVFHWSKACFVLVNI